MVDDVEATAMVRPFEYSGDPARNPELLTVNEVAGMLRVSKMTVYRLVHSGELPHVRVGRSFRLPADAVSALLAPTG